jgi:succinate dehydrogenase / fumarate reductase, cytochrome b subunit
MAQANRPLSPHLQIYRWYLTMAMSIIHRATGIAITVGLLGLTWWLVALATGPESYATAQSVLGNFLGGLILFGFTLALFLHGASGVRHLIWDLGYGIDKHTATRTSYWVLGAAVGLTLLTWLLVLIG